MKKKIGILTFHKANNYGAVLQAYALQSFLLSKGSEAYIIDYTPSFLCPIESVYHKKRFKDRSVLGKIKEFLLSPLIYSRRIKRTELFQSFVKNNLKLLTMDKLETTNFDIVIVGSDQVWNIKLTEGKDDFYGGYENQIKSKKWISYAASIGSCPIEEKYMELWKQYLDNFDEISVREEELIKMFRPLTAKQIYPVLDPVLLVDKHIWDKLLLPRPSEKYILVYQIYSDENVVEIARNLAKEQKCKIVQLSSKVDMFQGAEVKENALVQEFVSLFKYAECIVTTSFHGTAFSVINQKPFYTVRMGGNIDTRAESLLNNLGLSERMIAKSERPISLEIDYSSAEQNLEKFKNYSQAFLLNSMS